ncbi:DUF7535 family protein [Halonotius roseus]|uniref:Uncharacterized protein n=1 Tax=Halonotius roseus TaxID=2511997 RepID=A0A544QP87_9EURY|nr:hypothetical protein [Halonotius roseus]TQQ80742.1 hypothetical protein EWF95_09700 [Halonotius roseus]
MSSTSSDSGLLEPVYRTVTPGYGSHEDTSMDVIGWIMVLGILTLLFPLIPLFLGVVLIGKAISAVRSQTQSA